MSILYLLIFLIVLSTVSSQQLGCNGYFSYRVDEQGREYGHIVTGPPVDLRYNVVSLSVRFNVSQDIASSDGFYVESDGDIKRNVVNGLPIQYRVYFPATYNFNPRLNLPKLVSLEVNGETLCGKPLSDTLPDFDSDTVTLYHTTQLDPSYIPSDYSVSTQQVFTPAPPSGSQTGFDNGFGIYNKLEKNQNPGSGQTINIDQLQNLQINHFHVDSPQNLQSHRLFHDFFKKDPRLNKPIRTPGNAVNFARPEAGTNPGGSPSDPLTAVTFESVREPPGSNRRPPEPYFPETKPLLPSPQIQYQAISPQEIYKSPSPLPWSSDFINPSRDRLSAENLSFFGAPRPDFSAPIPWTDCGVSPINDLSSLPTSGSYERGDWPWVVAISRRSKDELKFKFICVGSLVTAKHVITAAHCIALRHETVPTGDILVKIGAFDLSDNSDENTQLRKVVDVEISETYNATTLEDDIGILTLDSPVRFDRYIKPVCLWNSKPELSKVVGTEGIVAGWGESEDTMLGTGTPNYVKMPIVSTKTCRESNAQFQKITSTRTLCAGSRNGIGPCRGDSGGGLYVLDSGRWRLRGIVSLSLRQKFGESSCNLDEYVVFTDTAQYQTWIDRYISDFKISALLPQGQGFGTAGSAAEITPFKPTLTQSGQISLQRPKIPSLFIECGKPSLLSESPWLVAIYKNMRGNIIFSCAGTLVSDRHVITAAQCLHSDNKQIPPKDIIIRAGVSNLEDFDNDNSKTGSVSSVIVHKDFNLSTLTYDIAILELRKYVSFSPFIRPICLWSNDVDFNRIVGIAGEISSWSLERDTPVGAGIKNSTRLVVLEYKTCSASRPDFNIFGPSFCTDGDGVTCLRELGTGLIIFDEGRWRLRGVASQLQRPKNASSCNPKDSIVFTDIARLSTWIQNYVPNNEFENKPLDPVTYSPRPTPGPIATYTPSSSLPTYVQTTPPPQRNKLFNPVTNPPWPSPGSNAHTPSSTLPTTMDTECGLSPYTGPETLDTGGSIQRGDWPWAVAIYGKTSTGGLKFVCIGSLVSPRHVITAGHCIEQRSSKRSFKDVIVKTGPHILNDWNEEGSQVRSLSSAVVNRNFNPTKFSNDIAILTFSTPVTITQFVRPVCLWNGNGDLENVVGQEGIVTVTGWGESEVGELPDRPPNYAKMPIVSQVDCLASNPAFAQLTSNTTLCAGARNGAGPCAGDSGGGLYVARNRRWMLRAVVLVALTNIEDEKPKCDLFNYVVFTDIAKFLPWIREVMSQPLVST